MMKRSKIKFLVIIFLSLLLILPNNVYAETLGDLKNQLASLRAKKAAQDEKKNQTQAQINANKKKEQDAALAVEEAKKEVQTLNEQIESTNKEIEELKEVTSSILILNQKLDKENIYISYITGASSMSDLVMRVEVIKELTLYNKEKLNELELLIETNNKLNKQLEEYQVKLNNKIKEYQEAINDLTDEMSTYIEGALSYAQQIDVLAEQVKVYQNMGCKDDQDIYVCTHSNYNNTGWLRPISQGRITSTYGGRTSPTAGASSYHRGVDIGVAEGTTVYGTAMGEVAAIVRGSSCGGNMVYVFTKVNGRDYTYVYMHLLSINVSVGQSVNVNTVIGQSGGGSTATRNGGYDRCTTGAHLHYGVAEGHNVAGFNAHSFAPPGYPGLYQWFYTR